MLRRLSFILAVVGALTLLGAAVASAGGGQWMRGDARIVGGTTPNYTSGLGTTGGTVTLRVQTNAADDPGQAVLNVAWEPPPAAMTPTETEPLSVTLNVTSLAYEGVFGFRFSPLASLNNSSLIFATFPFVDMSCTAGVCNTTPTTASVGSVDLNLGTGSSDGQVKTFQYTILSCGNACAVEWDYTWDADGAAPAPPPAPPPAPSRKNFLITSTDTKLIKKEFQ